MALERWKSPNQGQMYPWLKSVVVNLSGYLARMHRTANLGYGTAYASNAERNAELSDPVAGMFVHNTTDNQYQLFDGTGWLAWDLAWKSYTPSFPNVNIGTGGSAGLGGRWMRQGSRQVMAAGFKLGTSGVSVTDIRFSTPLTSVQNSAALGNVNVVVADAQHWCFFRDDVGGLTAMGIVRLEGVATMRAIVANANATFVGQSAVSSTVPFTWAANDEFACPYVEVDIAPADLYV